MRKKAKKQMNAALQSMSADFVIQVKNTIQSGGDMEAYDTGKLHKSIKMKKLKYLQYMVYTDVPYAKYVHEGTYKMAPRPFFSYTLAKNKARYEKFMLNEMKEFKDV